MLALPVIAIMAASVICFVWPNPAFANSPGDKGVSYFKSLEVASVDKKIMLLCIELARYNISFHQAVNKKTFFQQWLYPLQREAGTALSFSNTVIDLSQRARGFNNPDLISKPSQKVGVKCALVGQVITGSSSGMALAENLMQSYFAHRAGYAPASASANVKSIANRIDELLAERRSLVIAQRLPDPDGVYALQDRLLDHLKNQLIFEFKTWSMQSRSTEWAENTFYLLDSLQGFTQLASSCVSLKAFNNAKLGGAAAITNLSANAVVTINPIVRTLVGRYAAAYERKRLDNIFPGTRPKQIDEVLAETGKDLDLAAKDPGATAEVKELGFLIRRSAAFDAPLNKEVHRFEKLRRIADQQALSGPLIGLTGVTRGILNTTAFYAYQSKANSGNSNNESSSSSSSSSGDSGSTDEPSPNALRSNRLNLAGRIVQAGGQIYSLVLTPSTEIRHYLYLRALRKRNETPEQLLKARLVALDEIERRVKNGQFN